MMRAPAIVRRLSLIGGLVGLVASGGCERTVPVEPTGTAVALVGVVIAGADSVFISLGRARGAEVLLPEPGARLEISTASTIVRLDEDPGEACGILREFSCYRGRLGGLVEPGNVVALEGTLASGRQIGGAAIVPPLPDISADGAGPGDTVRAGPWEEARPEILGLIDEPFRVAAADTVASATVWAGEQRLNCRVRLPGPPPGFDLRRGFQAVLAVDAPSCLEADGVAWDSMAVPIVLLGYDANFTAWAGDLFLSPDEGPAGVQGVQGVFGAATPRTFVLVVTP